MLYIIKRPLIYIFLVFYNSGIMAFDLSSEFNETVLSFILHDSSQDETDIRSTKLKEKYLCVSLGFNCTTAFFLNKYGLRRLAFPFDWNVTSFKGLCDIIDNSFFDFLNPQNLNTSFCVYNTKYNIAFAHDFPTILQEDGSYALALNYLDYLDGITEKYQRRIKRFYKSVELAETVYFFRLKSLWELDTFPQDRNTIIKLRDVLISKFPARNWILVAIDNDSDYKTDWGLPMVKNFYIKNHRSEECWYKIFRELELLLE